MKSKNMVILVVIGLLVGAVVSAVVSTTPTHQMQLADEGGGDE